MSLKTIVLAALIAVVTLNIAAQETEPATTSNLAGINLPAGANRVLEASIPAEVNQAFDKIAAAGNGKFSKGETEVLVWAESNYSKAKAPRIVEQIGAALKADGWKFAIEGTEDGLTLFTALKEGANRRALIGFYGATDEALLFSWMEAVATNGTTEPVPRTESNSSIIGTWSNGSTSMLGEKYQNGTIAFRNGTIQKYTFNANGTFEVIGYVASTMYGCTTTLFNDKRGKYQFNGSQITLIPSKNFWRNENSCSPASKKERDYTLDRETYEVRVRRNDYGKNEICLINGKGEMCYERKE